jgi:hypothetical protein
MPIPVRPQEQPGEVFVDPFEYFLQPLGLRSACCRIRSFNVFSMRSAEESPWPCLKIDSDELADAKYALMLRVIELFRILCVNSDRASGGLDFLRCEVKTPDVVLVVVYTGSMVF